MDKQSMIDVAYAIIKKEGKIITFKELYNEVALNLEMDDATKIKNIGEFYTQLTVDGRFVALGDNTWDLRERHTYEKSHDESINEVYNEVEDDSDVDAVDKQEEKEYNAEIEGKEIVEDDSDEETSSDADSEDDETVKYTDEDVSTLIGK